MRIGSEEDIHTERGRIHIVRTVPFVSRDGNRLENFIFKDIEVVHYQLVRLENFAGTSQPTYYEGKNCVNVCNISYIQNRVCIILLLHIPYYRRLEYTFPPHLQLYIHT